MGRRGSSAEGTRQTGKDGGIPFTRSSAQSRSVGIVEHHHSDDALRIASVSSSIFDMRRTALAGGCGHPCIGLHTKERRRNFNRGDGTHGLAAERTATSASNPLQIRRRWLVTNDTCSLPVLHESLLATTTIICPKRAQLCSEADIFADPPVFADTSQLA